jgi:hypothetical protein
MKLTASSAYRFTSCPGSVKLSDNTPAGLIYRPAAEAARIGTIIHDMGEETLKAIHAGKKPPTIAQLCKKHGVTDPVVKEKAKNAVKGYASWFKKELKQHKNPRVLLEKKFRLTRGNYEYVFKADCMVVSKDRLVIADLKTGNFDYSSSAYQQVLFSAALYLESTKKSYSLVKGVIIQPNFFVESERVVEIDISIINNQGAAYFDSLEQQLTTEEINPGPHCTFCNALLTCPYMQNMTGIVTALAMHGEPEAVNLDTLQEIYLNKDNIEKFLKSVEGLLTEKMTKEGEILDKVMLKTTYGRRRWNDPKEVEQRLSYLKEKIYEPKKLKSPAQVEKIAGKKNIEGLYSTPEYLKPAPRISEFE